MKLPVNRDQVKDIAWRRYTAHPLPVDHRPPCSPHFLRPAGISLLCGLPSPLEQPSRASLRASCVYSCVYLLKVLLTSTATFLIEQGDSIQFRLCALALGSWSDPPVIRTPSPRNNAVHHGWSGVTSRYPQLIGCRVIACLGGNPRDPSCNSAIQSSSHALRAGTNGLGQSPKGTAIQGSPAYAVCSSIAPLEGKNGAIIPLPSGFHPARYQQCVDDLSSIILRRIPPVG